MERIMRSQAFSDPSKQAYMASQKTMELNPRHPLIAGMLARFEAEPDAEALKDTAWLLYDTALLQSGFQMEAVDEFASRMYRTMKGSLGIDNTLELEDEIDVPAEKDEAEEDDEEEEKKEDDGSSDSDEL
jgi:heat shock protein beta